MAKLLVWLFFITASLHLKAQKVIIENTKKIYFDAISRHVRAPLSKDSGSIFVLKNDLLEEYMPVKVGGYKVLQIETETIHLSKVDEKNSFFIRVFPIEIDSESLVIRIIDFIPANNNGELILKNSGGTSNCYKYNISLKRFTFYKQNPISN